MFLMRFLTVLISARSALLPLAARLVGTRISSNSNTLSLMMPVIVSSEKIGTFLRASIFLSRLPSFRMR